MGENKRSTKSDDIGAFVQKIIKEHNITDKIEKRKYACNLMCKVLIKYHKYDCMFTDEEQTRISNMAVFYSLLIWIESDKESRQTIKSFARQPYTPISEQRKECPIPENKYDIEIRAAELRYYESMYRNNIILRGRQAKSENLKFNKPAYKRKYDFIALRFMDLLHEGNLDIYKLLFQRKYFLKRTATGKDDGLLEAFKNYINLIDSINTCKNKKEFVIGCLQFVKFENAYRVLLVSQLAECMIEKNISSYQDALCIIQTMYYRLTQEFLLFPSSLQTTFIGGYTYIKDAFDKKITPNILMKMSCARILIEEITYLISHIFRVKKDDTWTENDYDSAAHFLTDDFCILQEFDDLNFDKIQNKALFTEYVRKIYSDNILIPCEFIENGRNNLCRRGTKKKSNKKH